MNPKLAEKNYEFCNETIDFAKNINSSYLELSPRLKKIRDENLYEPNYETFADFLKEIDVSQGTASRLIQIQEVFVDKYKVSRAKLNLCGWTKLAEVVGHVTSKRNAESWVLKAQHLTKTDIRREVTEKKTGISPETCKHKGEEYTDWRYYHLCKGRVVLKDTRKNELEQSKKK